MLLSRLPMLALGSRHPGWTQPLSFPGCPRVSLAPGLSLILAPYPLRPTPALFQALDNPFQAKEPVGSLSCFSGPRERGLSVWLKITNGFRWYGGWKLQQDTPKLGGVPWAHPEEGASGSCTSTVPTHPRTPCEDLRALSV